MICVENNLPPMNFTGQDLLCTYDQISEYRVRAPLVWKEKQEVIAGYFVSPFGYKLYGESIGLSEFQVRYLVQKYKQQFV